MYDWANSVYSLVITTAIFPLYYSGVTAGANGLGIVNVLGFHVKNSILFSWALSAAFLVIACFSPLLTAIADFSGKKKLFMKFFCYLGSASCALLWFFTSDTVVWGIFAFIFATIGFTGSIVFYNSFLPEIATPDKFDSLSARGFSYGYIGSVILLVLNLLPIIKPEWFGNISAGTASRIAFVCTGLWWAGFAQISFNALPSNPYQKKPDGNWIIKGYAELGKVWREMKSVPKTQRFLFAFFFWNMGVQTVMYLATIFGESELHLPTTSLILTVLLLQLLAIVGSLLFAAISRKFGNRAALAILIVIWIGICCSAYYVSTANQFYLLAAVVGSVMGGIQSLSRSTYAKLIPAHTTDHAAWFSFYDVTDKLSIVIGTFAYGLIESATGSMRNSTLGLAGFFIIGLILLKVMGKSPLLMTERKQAVV